MINLKDEKDVQIWCDYQEETRQTSADYFLRLRFGNFRTFIISKEGDGYSEGCNEYCLDNGDGNGDGFGYFSGNGNGDGSGCGEDGICFGDGFGDGEFAQYTSTS